MSPKRQKSRIERNNARPFITTYPATENVPALHVLSIPKGASKRSIKQAISLLPNVKVRDLL